MLAIALETRRSWEMPVPIQGIVFHEGVANSGQEHLARVRAELQNGKPVARVTVREFLQWFGVQKRGHWIKQEIRVQLGANGLKTDPDFEEAHYDTQIDFELLQPKANSTSDSLPPPPQPVDAVQSSAQSLETSEPSFRISRLIKPNALPVRVAPDADLSEAVTKMILHDYSQLPVMTNDREVKGVITWQTIATATITSGRSPSKVREAMGPSPHDVHITHSIFAAIPLIIANQFVLVRDQTKCVCGIVTVSDLSSLFQQLSEPFLLLSEIEGHLRQMLDTSLDPAEIKSGLDPRDGEREVKSAANLSFGEYIRLFEGAYWEKMRIPLDRRVMCDELNRIRAIRNNVMHFDPDGIEADERIMLGKMRAMLQWLAEMKKS